MASPSTSRMFRFSYTKTIEELKTAMAEKIEFLKNKILERQARIKKIREEENITDQDLIDLLTQAANQAVSNARVGPMSYSLTSDANDGEEVRYIAAGTVQNLLAEKSLIESENGSIVQMNRVLRNLRPIKHHADDGTEYTQESFGLNDEELDYLGF
jgi:hypothetical protein